MTLIRSVTATPRQPRLHVTVVRSLRVRHREQEALAAVEEPTLQHVGAEERPEAVADAARKRYAATGLDDHRRARSRIAVGPAQRVLEPGHRRMVQHAGEARHRSVADDALVHEIVGETRPASPEQA